MSVPPEPEGVAALQARFAALQQAAASGGAQPGDLLDAAFAELEGAIDLLRAAETGPGQPRDRGPAGSAPPGYDSAERSLLRAAFADAPVPLFLLTRDGTVQRVNKSAGDLIGAKPGYATGRPFPALVHLPSRAAVNSQLTAVARTGRPRRIRCSLAAADGLVPCELIIGRVGIRGRNDQDDPLMVAVGEAARRPASPAQDAEMTDAAGSRPGAVQAVTRRLDLVTAMARLLLENEGFSESRMLQRCARLIAGELTAWVIVDVERRHRMRRQFVAGPEGAGLAELTSAVAAVDPPPGSVPCTVHEAGRPVLIAHAEDTAILGASMAGEPLLVKLDATSVLSVPLSDGENRYGAATLVRRAADGHFKVADLALAEELGAQMALAIRVDRMFRRRADTAEALHASLQPRKMPEIPDVEVAATYLAAAEELEVGGDFYDVYHTPDGWGLAVGDVCGKGEEAAAVTATARHAIRVLARRCADPGEVLAGANEIIAADLGPDGGFVTANIAHLTWQDGRLHVVLASAGHPAAMLLLADGRVRVARGGGLPLGLFPDAEPARQEVVLDPGDVLFLYTDGVAQARGQDNAYFAERLADELTSLAGQPPVQLVAAMRRAMLDFTGGNNLVDDVTMLVLRAGRPSRGSTAPARAPGHASPRPAASA
ncbi:MAG: SpoIIE family protein phosphatase [Actinobacteria bacterium]|nr:SpoIIE family protein phosphatase [Actinomycetota bacterium]